MLPNRSIFDFGPERIDAIRVRVEDCLHPIPFVGCTVYAGRAESGNGYSKVQLYGVTFAVHRVTYELKTGARIPPGLLLDHTCRWRPCCDPAHMEPVTTHVNTLRGNAILFKPRHCE